MGQLEQEFDKFMFRIFGMRINTVPTIQRYEMKKAYYAGAYACLTHEGDHEKRGQLLKEINNTYAEFNKSKSI